MESDIKDYLTAYIGLPSNEPSNDAVKMTQAEQILPAPPPSTCVEDALIPSVPPPLLKSAAPPQWDPLPHLDPALAPRQTLPFRTSGQNVLYLAYGSNLAASTFRGRRGVRPLRAVNVVVPQLRLTFDLPGIPYMEPCFANTAPRDPDTVAAAASDEDNSDGYDEPAAGDTPVPPSATFDHDVEKLSLLRHDDRPEYHKDRWHKGLVGVVYEVTPSDYAHIISTEGGGTAYRDVLVTCFPLPSGADTVPTHPGPEGAFVAHTLFAPARNTPGPRVEAAGVAGGQPATDEKKVRDKDGREDWATAAETGAPVRVQRRPDPSYAQPTARYLKLLTTGAVENDLPAEYRAYLAGIRPYRITTYAQRVGQFVFLMAWAPFVLALMLLQRRVQDKEGKVPSWVGALSRAIFGGAWFTYDGFFKGLFGDGERTIGDR